MKKVFVKKVNGRSAGRRQRTGKYACSEAEYSKLMKAGDHCPQYRVVTGRPVIINKKTKGISIPSEQQARDIMYNQKPL